MNDLVLDAEGRKMSKRIGNIVDPWQVIARHGVDAVRLFLVASSNVWVPRRFDEKVIREQAGRFFVTLKNIYSGVFAQYASFGWSPSSDDPAPDDRPPLDRWVLGRLSTLQRAVDEALEGYDATAASRAIIAFVDDDLANWYVRHSRARFYDVDGADNRSAFATLHEVLTVVCRLLAPISPFVTDWMHRQLTGTSVHLAPFGGERAHAVDAELDAAMSAIREVARLGRAAREEAGIRVRQPLQKLVCVAPGVSMRALELVVGLLAAELNVKEVRFAASGDEFVTLEAKPNFRALGKRWGKKTPQAAVAIAALASADLLRFEHGEPVAITVDGDTHMLDAEEVTILRRASGELVVQEAGGFLAAIDPSVTRELGLEGQARELISRVQRMRKEAGLAVSDRIVLTVAGGDAVQELVRTHGAWIASEVLATELVLVQDLSGTYLATQRIELDELEVHVALTRTP